jgi:hypothetical protein
MEFGLFCNGKSFRSWPIFKEELRLFVLLVASPIDHGLQFEQKKMHQEKELTFCPNLYQCPSVRKNKRGTARQAKLAEKRTQRS